MTDARTQRRDRAIELLTEIRGRYEQMVREFPESASMAYYREHVAGLDDAIDLLRRGAA